MYVAGRDVYMGKLSAAYTAVMDAPIAARIEFIIPGNRDEDGH
jgi:hypothetical protein